MALALRLYAQFADRTTLANVFAVVERCRHDLEAADGVVRPDVVENLARRRLTGMLEQPS